MVRRTVSLIALSLFLGDQFREHMAPLRKQVDAALGRAVATGVEGSQKLNEV